MKMWPFGKTRPRRPLAGTYSGLAILGIGGGTLGTLFCTVLFLFREQCEPVVRLIAPLLFPRNARGKVDFDEVSYYYFAGLAVMMTVIWVGITVIAVLKKPQEDERIRVEVRKGLRARGRENMGGAPIDPL